MLPPNSAVASCLLQVANSYSQGPDALCVCLWMYSAARFKSLCPPNQPVHASGWSTCHSYRSTVWCQLWSSQARRCPCQGRPGSCSALQLDRSRCHAAPQGSSVALQSPAVPLLTGSIKFFSQVDSKVCCTTHWAGQGPQIARGSRPAKRGLWQQQQSRTAELIVQWEIQQRVHISLPQWGLRGRCRWARLCAAGSAVCHASAAGGPGITAAHSGCMMGLLQPLEKGRCRWVASQHPLWAAGALWPL